MSNFEGESLGSWLKVNDPRTETLRSFLESILGKHPLFADENKTRAGIAAMNCEHIKFRARLSSIITQQTLISLLMLCRERNFILKIFFDIQ